MTSSSTEASTSFLSSSDTPPIRSAAFSRSASQREASSEAPRSDSTYTDAPLTLRSGTASACTARLADAAAQRDEVVAVADQHGAHALLRVDLLREAACDGERHVLLARAAAADGARILATVTCVDRNDEVAALCVRGDALHRRGARRSLRHRRRAGREHLLAERRLGRRRPGGRGHGRHLDYEAVPCAALGRHHEALHRLARREVQDDAQPAIGLRTRADIRHRALTVRQRLAHREPRVLQVDDDALGVLDAEQLVSHRRAQVKDEPGALRARPEADVLDRNGDGRSPRRGKAQRQERTEERPPRGRASRHAT